jgi:DDE family transposase
MAKLTKRSVKQLLECFPKQLLSKIGEQTGVDKNVSRLYGDRMFKLLLFSMLRSDRISTRVMEYFYSTPFFNALSGKGGHTTRHSSIADRLMKMNPEYFEQLFEWSVSYFGKQLPGSGLLKKIKRFDSTMVGISSALVEWGMRVGRIAKEGHPVVQLKFTMGMHAHLPSSIKSFFDQSHLSEETALKEAILASELQQGDLVVFDKGLKSRKTFQSFDNQNIRFITTGSTNIRYEALKKHRNIKGRKADGLRFIQDVKVHLYGDSKQLIEHPFRLIEAEILENGESIFFITNIWDLSAMQIARVYKHRWDIEVFFRFIKQQLNIKHLINRSENGVKIQIFSALIAAILVLVFKFGNKIPSYKIAKMKFEDDLLLLLVNELKEKTPP